MAEYYEKSAESTLAELGADAAAGLTPAEAEERLRAFGENAFEEERAEGVLIKAARSMRDISTLILLAAAALSLAMALRDGEGAIEFIVIIGIVVLNTALAVSQEMSAERELAALGRLAAPTSLVLRGGQRVVIKSAGVVPGDILLLKTGDLITADARLIESYDLAADESALTGESAPAEKDARAVLPGKAAAGDRANMVFSGCLVTAGRGAAVVTATGMSTEIGRIAGYLNDAQKLQTPLQARLAKLGRAVSLAAVASAAAVITIDVMRGVSFWDTVFVAVSLAVAAVPETLQLIVTLALARGVREMAARHALIRKLPAVETLGGASVICTDKTGTLTQNKMAVKRLWLGRGEPFEDACDFTAGQAAFLNKFALASGEANDATEAAIMSLFAQKGGEPPDKPAAEIPFSSARKMMTAIHKDPAGGFLALTKGAPDRVPFKDAGEDELKARRAVHDAFARDALRIIALGSRHLDGIPKDLSEAEKELDFEGYIGLIDPPRPEAAQAVATARDAGVRTVMITGDHAATAAAIGRQIGLFSADQAEPGDGRVVSGLELAAMSDEELVANVRRYAVYARVSPEDKIRIVEAWQEAGEVVAMTGDGVNDAPALKAADVGVAMGVAGTDVAKAAADMILTDDNFASIVAAVRKGRDVFSNIKKTVYFLLVCNFSEIAIMLGAQLMGWGLPLTPIMLLLINVLGDGVPGLRLAYEKSDPRIMRRGPIRRDESLFEGLVFPIALQIVSFTAVAWAGYYIGAYAAPGGAHVIGQTMCFLIVGWTSILHVFTVRSRKSVFRRTLKDNPGIVLAAAGMVALFALIVLAPPLAHIFGMTRLSPEHWLIAAGLSLVPIFTAELGKLARSAREKREHCRRLMRHAEGD